MTESPISPYLRTARDYLDAAADELARGGVREIAAAYGVRLLSQLLHQVSVDLEEYEMAELAAVYDILAIQVTSALGLTDTDATFRALAELCDDKEARRLVGGQPAPTAEQLRCLRSRLLWITVSYRAGAGEPSGRVCEITYINADGELRSASASVDFGYEQLPARARKRILDTGQLAVRYQLYPVPNRETN